MWVRTQDGKTTIKVDRFTIIEEVSGPRYSSEPKEAIIRGNKEFDAFMAIHKDDEKKLISHDNVYDVEKCEWVTVWKIVYREAIYDCIYFIVCGDVVLGTYSSLERAEKVRDYMESYIMEDFETILWIPKDEEVDQIE
jgi:hypothetical protein